jgi:hypothetical protein
MLYLKIIRDFEIYNIHAQICHACKTTKTVINGFVIFNTTLTG